MPGLPNRKKRSERLRDYTPISIPGQGPRQRPLSVRGRPDGARSWERRVGVCVSGGSSGWTCPQRRSRRWSRHRASPRCGCGGASPGHSAVCSPFHSNHRQSYLVVRHPPPPQQPLGASGTTLGTESLPVWALGHHHHVGPGNRPKNKQTPITR